MVSDTITGESLTAGLIRLIRAKPVAERDLRWMAVLALDGIANAAAGLTTEPGRILTEWLGGRGCDPGRRAFGIGGCMHVLEMDDLHRASVVHPGCVVLPAAIALAEATPRSGRAVLRAMLSGFEAAARVGMAAGPAHYRIWHNTATCGPYGAAMAAAELLGLDDAAALHALGNAGTQSAGLWQFLETGAMTKHLHAGRAAEAGVVAATLAALGFTGPPAILEGSRGFFAAACPDADPAAVLRAPQSDWQAHATSIKPWPSCRHTHPAIDAALELASRLDPESIRAVEVATYRAALDVCDRPQPSGAYDAKFSLQHCVAAALQTGRIGFDSFDDAARRRAAPLRAKVRLRVGEPYNSAYPTDWGGEVAVTMTTGERLLAARRACKGDPDSPLVEAEIIDKARMLLSLAGVADAEKSIAAILAMAEDAPLPPLPF